jgi:hypothetical protein
MGNLTVEQIASVVMDSGLVYINYGELDERELAPLKGGSTFVVEQEFKDIEFDGMRGKTKGMRRIISENAYATVNLMGLTQENIKLALAGANIDGTTKAITNGSGAIADSEYLKNITIICKTMGDEYKIITLYNALSDNGLSLSTVDKEESVVALNLSAHYDPANLESPIYKIEEVETLA